MCSPRSKRIGLVFAAGVLLAGVVTVYGFFDPSVYPFPPCPFRKLTGWLCPGCGSQRAFHQLLQGHFREAFRLHPLFLPALLYLSVGFGLATLGLRGRNRFWRLAYGATAARISLVVIVSFWIWRNLAG